MQNFNTGLYILFVSETPILMNNNKHGLLFVLGSLWFLGKKPRIQSYITFTSIIVLIWLYLISTLSVLMKMTISVGSIHTYVYAQGLVIWVGGEYTFRINLHSIGIWLLRGFKSSFSWDWLGSNYNILHEIGLFFIWILDQGFFCA